MLYSTKMVKLGIWGMAYYGFTNIQVTKHWGQSTSQVARMEEEPWANLCLRSHRT